MELRFKTTRATIAIDLTVQRIAAATEADANQRVRDMLQDAVHLTFKRRRTHELPTALVEPRRDWKRRFLDTVFSGVEEFFERMMKGGGGRS